MPDPCQRCQHLTRLLERCWDVMFLPDDGVLKYDVTPELLDLRNALADVLIERKERDV